MTTNYSTYSSINSLSEISMIAGNDMTLTFNIFEEDGITPLNISGYTAIFVIAPFGNFENVSLQKTGVVGTTSFDVRLLSSDTEMLSGKYVYQPILTSGIVILRPSQGTILIQPRIVNV